MMRVEVGVPCPLPDDPVLAGVAIAVLKTEDWGSIVDANWRRVYSSDDERRSFAGGGEMAATVIGEHLFGPESVAVMSEARFAMKTPETWRSFFGGLGGLVLCDTPGGKQELRELVDPSLRDQVDQLSPSDAAVVGFRFRSFGLVAPQPMHCKAVRIRDDRGALRGTFISSKLAAPMSILSAMAFERDADHLPRGPRSPDDVRPLTASAPGTPHSGPCPQPASGRSRTVHERSILDSAVITKRPASSTPAPLPSIEYRLRSRHTSLRPSVGSHRRALLSITMYIHHKILDPEAMAAGAPAGLDERLEARGHDFTETWYVAGDMSHALLIAEFGSSQDMVAHFDELDASGFTQQAIGNVFEITSADVIGDVDDDARAALSRYDFVNFLAPMPQG